MGGVSVVMEDAACCEFRLPPTVIGLPSSAH